LTAVETSIKAPAQFSLRDLFRIHSYRMIWTGQIVSDFGDSMTRLALLLLINKMTGSVSAIATMTIVLALPRLLFGFIAGVYVDRLNRKTLMIISDILRGSFVLGFILVNSPERIWLLYMIGFLQGAVATFFEPSRMALLPNLVPAEGLLSANSVSQTSQNIFYMLGNAAAGVLVGTLGTYAPIFLVNSVTFFTSAILISQIRYQHQPAQSMSKMNAQIFLGQLWEGVKISFGNRILFGTIAAISLTMLGVGAVNVLMIPMLINDLHIPETWLGATNAGQVIGILISGGLIAGLSSRFRSTNLVVIGLIGFGISMAGIAGAGSIWYIILIQFVAGLFIPAITASTQTILQVAVPDSLRGRTGAARMVLIILSNLVSMGMAGILADKIGARNVFIISGACAVLGGVAAGVIFRGMEVETISIEPSNQTSES
jgi:MFS family permease